MSLARAVTKRIKRTEVPDMPTSPTRSQSVKNTSTQIDRSKISAPLALVSTTNMLSYNAPDIATMRLNASPTSSTNSSADDSDNSYSGRSRASSHSSGSLTDASSVDFPSPAPNHLSGYFGNPQPPPSNKLRKSASTTSLKKVKEEPVEEVPALPARALSHSKRAHERMAAKRSMTVTGRPGSRTSAGSSSVRSRSTHERKPSIGREQRSSIEMFRDMQNFQPPPPPQPAQPKQREQHSSHPFGRELQQLNEIVEEFGGVVRDAETEADLNAMRKRNLAAFCAADYLSEIRPLFSTRFGIPQQAAPMAWI